MVISKNVFIVVVWTRLKKRISSILLMEFIISMSQIRHYKNRLFTKINKMFFLSLKKSKKKAEKKEQTFF